MCLIVVAIGAAPAYPLIVAANRDERHARPAAPAEWWPDPPHVLGGRDLEAGGTWLAVDRRARFAAVTNIRDPDRRPGLRSRGSLVVDYLAGGASAAGSGWWGAPLPRFSSTAASDMVNPPGTEHRLV